MSRPRTVDHDRLRSLLRAGRGKRTLSEIAAEMGIGAAYTRTLVSRFRKSEPDIWPTDDARLREDSLTRRLVENAGISIHPDCYQDTLLQRLRQVSRLRAGLPLSGRENAEREARAWEAGLRRDRQVVDLDGEGRPAIRRALAWELDDSGALLDIICAPKGGA